MNSQVMNWFFSSAIACERLIAVAKQWEGTPFAAHSAIRGAGVDCVNLVAQIYIAAGFKVHFDLPTYTLQQGKHVKTSPLIDWFDRNPDFRKVDHSHLAPGDALCFQFKQRVPHHVGLKLAGDKFVHIVEKREVEIVSLKGAYLVCIKAAYRPVNAIGAARPSQEGNGH